MHKRLLPFAMAAVMMLSFVTDVHATTISDVTNQKKQTESSLNSVNNQIGQIEERQEQLRFEVEAMDTQLVEVLTSISICKDEIVAKEEQVSQIKEELAEAKEQEQFQYDAMKQRIRFMYEKGDSAYLQIFLESKSLSDMLNKADYVEKLYTYDRELLETYTLKKEETKQKKEQLEEEEAELLSANYELEQEQGSLEKMIAEKRATISGFDSQLASAKAQAEQYKKELNKQTQQLRKLEEEERQKELARKKAEEEAKKKAKAEAEKEKEQQANKAENGDTGSTGEETDTGTGNGGAKQGSAQEPQTGGDAASSEETTATDEKESDLSASKADPGDSALGQQIADYATQFVGNPYVFGGTSLTNGTDCSGFTMSVYAHFGISIPRDSTSQRSAGRAVSYAQAQPGDIICYAGHVALYIGNGQIVHASTEATGIKYSAATYRTILAVRRIV